MRRREGLDDAAEAMQISPLTCVLELSEYSFHSCTHPHFLSSPPTWTLPLQLSLPRDHLALPTTEKLKELEEKTGYPKAYFALAIAALLTGVLTLLGGAKLLVDLVGFVYPAYMSFKSMDANNGEDTQWLTYWVVFAFFSIVEGMAGFLTRLIPFYYITKTGFILWLYHPQTSKYCSVSTVNDFALSSPPFYSS